MLLPLLSSFESLNHRWLSITELFNGLWTGAPAHPHRTKVHQVCVKALFFILLLTSYCIFSGKGEFPFKRRGIETARGRLSILLHEQIQIRDSVHVSRLVQSQETLRQIRIRRIRHSNVWLFFPRKESRDDTSLPQIEYMQCLSVCARNSTVSFYWFWWGG